MRAAKRLSVRTRCEDIASRDGRWVRTLRPRAGRVGAQGSHGVRFASRLGDADFLASFLFWVTRCVVACNVADVCAKPPPAKANRNAAHVTCSEDATHARLAKPDSQRSVLDVSRTQRKTYQDCEFA